VSHLPVQAAMVLGSLAKIPERGVGEVRLVVKKKNNAIDRAKERKKKEGKRERNRGLSELSYTTRRKVQELAEERQKSRNAGGLHQSGSPITYRKKKKRTVEKRSH